MFTSKWGKGVLLVGMFVLPLALAGCPPYGPSTVSVPGVVGLTQSAAESSITSAGLSVGTVTEQCSETAPPGQVISQNPAAGASAERNASVALVISLGQRLGAAFSTSVTEGDAPLAVRFFDDSVASGSGSITEKTAITQWRWDLGDGTTSDEPEPIHVYEAPGTYSVSLKVHDNLNGFEDTVLQTDLIVVYQGTDSDGDGLSDSLEATLGTDPSLWDTDGDTFNDGAEYLTDRDPLFAQATPVPNSLVVASVPGLEVVSVDEAQGTMVLEYTGGAKAPLIEPGMFLFCDLGQNDMQKWWGEDIGAGIVKVWDIGTEIIATGVRYYVSWTYGSLLEAFINIDEEFQTPKLQITPEGWPLNDEVIYDKDGLALTITKAEFIFAAVVTTTIEAQGLDLEKVGAMLDGQCTVWLDIDVTVAKSYTWEKEIPIGDVHLPVPVFPALTVDLSVDAILDAYFEGKGSVTTGFDFTQDVNVGFVYENDEVYEIKGFDKEMSLHPPEFKASAKACARVTLSPSVGVSIHGTAGAYVALRPFIEGSAEAGTHLDNCLIQGSLDVGIDAKAAIYADLFVWGNEFAIGPFPDPPLTKNLWNGCVWSLGDNDDEGPSAAFSATPTLGQAPLTVSFKDESDPGSAPITSWKWDFGDGATSSRQNPSHQYDSEGAYSVSLTVTTSVDSDTDRKMRHVRVWGEGECSLLWEDFDDGIAENWSTNQGGDWETVDGEYRQLSTVPVDDRTSIYSGPGATEWTNYTARVDFRYIQGSNPTNAVYFSFRYKDENNYYRAQLQNLSLQPAGGIPETFFVFRVENGVSTTLHQEEFDLDASMINNIEITALNDSFSIYLNDERLYSFTDSSHPNGTIGIASGHIAVGFDNVCVSPAAGEGEGPTAAFRATPTLGWAPLNVSFTDESYPGSAPITSWKWDFGDGATSSQQNPGHQYDSEGAYSVSLTVTTSIGADTETKAKYVTVHPRGVPPTAAFEATPTSGPASLTVMFMDQSDPGSATITDWLWDFGDGGSSTAEDCIHIYETAGTYDVSLTVTTSVASDTETKTRYITVDYGRVRAPTDVSASDGSYSDKIRVTWSDVTGEDGYKVFRSRISTGTYAQIGTVGANVTEYDDPVGPDQARWYKVKAYNSAGDSLFSDMNQGYTDSDGEAWVRNPANGHEYRLTEEMTWWAACDVAWACGGYLTTINDSSENAWIVSTFPADYTHFFIGLSDCEIEGLFMWINGEHNSYRNWNSGEPNDRDGIEDCCEIWLWPDWDANGTWNDCSGDILGKGIVERDPAPMAAAQGVFFPRQH